MTKEEKELTELKIKLYEQKKEQYAIKKKQLDYIEALTGICMDFQRGLLEYENSSDKRFMILNEGALDSEYQAGLRYASLQNEKTKKLKNDEHKN